MTTDTPSTSSEGVDVLDALSTCIKHEPLGPRLWVLIHTRNKFAELIEAAENNLNRYSPQSIARLGKALRACRATPGAHP